MLSEDNALQMVDDELHAALGGLKAPTHLSANVLRRVRHPIISPKPEVLDSIGWLAILAGLLIASWTLTPVYLMPAAMFIFGFTSVVISLAFAVRTASTLKR